MRRFFLILFLTFSSVAFAAEEFVVVIDAGHGGKDPGSQSANRKINEKDIALSVALRTGELIQKRHPDVKVLYTRKKDVYVTLNGRAAIANKAKADLFISIHTNAAESRQANGAEVFVLGTEDKRTSANLNVAKRENSVILLEKDYEKNYQGYDPNSPESTIIFEFMQSEYLNESIRFAEKVQKELVSTAGRHNRGVHQAGFLVLHATSMPSILVELGFISNANECSFLNSSNGKEKCSNSIANAFDAYYSDLQKDQQKKVDTKESQKKEVSNKEQINKEEKTTINEGTQSKDVPKEAQIAENEQEKALTNTSEILFKVQFLSSDKELPSGSSQFKGIKPDGFYKDNGWYRYTKGESANLAEIQQLRKKISQTFKDAFIVAFRNGERMDIKKAIEEYNSTH
ncbi:MAG: N-acetylmuramoyl-L-alanine amidase [Bacteroidaceae bacterium]|nr:N-acetylmuramoyl-L-alanine amidase [Bacteroidaceae bacterium]